jgi:hypothetical protein
MRFFKIVFVTLGIVFVINLAELSMQLYLKEPVYACEEVTKADPVSVQKICNRRWRRK